MKKFEFKKIDAFATHSSDGNPAGYIRLNAMTDLTAQEMLNIAKELKGFVNEVGYVVQLSDDIFELKYFSAVREVDFCGHATVAIMYDLIVSDGRLRQFDEVRIRTIRGELRVENRIKKEDAVFIMSPKPVFNNSNINPAALASKLKIKADEIDPSRPIAVINAGLSTLLVPLKSLTSTLNIRPDQEALKSFCFDSNIDLIEVFTSDVANKTNHFRVRVFAPTFGYLEDPATGSGNSALGYYLIKHGLWSGDTIAIEQNEFIDRYNIVKLQRTIDTDGNHRILFGGSAITRVEGKYTTHS